MIHQVKANGLDFAYFEEGAGPLALLLHGFPDTAHTWDAVRPALAGRGYRAVSPFMRGYPPTEIPADGPFDVDTLGDDVLALIEALGDEPAVVIGHDWGAAAAYAAAAKGSSRVRRLVTVAAPHPAAVRPSPRLLWGVRHFFTLSLPGAAARIRAGGLAHIDELVARWSPGWDVPAGETTAVKRALERPGALEAALGYYRAMRTPPRGKAISIPTVAVAALDDGILTLADYERARRCFVGPYSVVPMPGGHFPHRQHPELFIEKLLARLSC